jgi:hypothetical protein
MKRVACCLILCCLTLVGCMQKVPKPASVFLSSDKALAHSDLVGRKIDFYVDKASGRFKPYYHKVLTGQFELAYRYVLKPKGHLDDLSQGYYTYSVDEFNLDQGTLVMQGNQGLTARLFYTSRSGGHYQARSSQVRYPGQISGRFRIKAV